MDSENQSDIKQTKENSEEIAEKLKHPRNQCARNSSPNLGNQPIKSREMEDNSYQLLKTSQIRPPKTQLFSRQPSIAEPISRKLSLALTRSTLSALTFRPSRFKFHRSFLPAFYEPTYRLEPNPSEKFNQEAVETVLKEELERQLSHKIYDPEMVSGWIPELCSTIRKAVKELNYKRYKIACFVLLAQNLGQGLHSASRCLWHGNFDNRATWIFSNSSIICDASVFGMYCE